MRGSQKTLPWDRCIICNRKGYNYSQKRESGRQLNKPVAKAYHNEANDGDCIKKRLKPHLMTTSSSSALMPNSILLLPVVSQQSLFRLKFTRRIVDAALIDTGSNNIFCAGLLLLPVAKIANMKSMRQDMKDNERR